MSIVDTVARLAHLLVALAAVLLVAQLGRMAARTVRQPTVVAEIAAGMLIGPAILGLGGQHMLAVLLPADVLGRLRMVGYVGLVLFLVGIGHHLRDVPHRTARTVAWTALGAWLVPLLCGGLFAVWVLSRDDRALRGDAPAPAFVLFVGIGLSVTAIPVLARILVDRGLLDSEVGGLAMTVAVVLDLLTFLLLAVALGLGRGASGVLVAVGTLALGVLTAMLARRVLSTGSAGRLALRFHRLTVVFIALVALAAAEAIRLGGLTDIFGALLVGFAMPTGERARPWDPAVHTLSRFGRWLVPVFFVSTGITAFGRHVSSMPWPAIALAIGLAIAGKTLGSYLGARLGGASPPLASRLGVLLSTRGLTELVVLQIGYAAGLLTPTLLTALVVMALVTTALVGPAYTLLDRSGAPAPSAPSAASAEFRSMMAAFPTGVAVVAALAPDGRPWGMTCSSVCSVTLEPPTLLICLRKGSPTLRALLRRSRFTVNLLHKDARRTAELFASGDPDRFDRIGWRCGPSFGGPHLVDDAHAIADCVVTSRLTIGDHVVVFGEVFAVERRAPTAPNPLLYGLRQYSSWTPGHVDHDALGNAALGDDELGGGRPAAMGTDGAYRGSPRSVAPSRPRDGGIR